MTYENQVQANTTHRGIDLLPLAIKFPGFKKGSALYFLEDNQSKIKIIQETLAKLEPTESIISTSNYPEKQLGISFFSFNRKISTPTIEFKRINPTKYRLRVHGVTSEFPLIFSETYHHEWNLYLVPWKDKQSDLSSYVNLQKISSHRVINEKDQDQATQQELLSFVQKGWVSDLKKKKPKNISPYNFLTGLRSTPEPSKAFEIDFISKNFSGTIQNNNLPDGDIDETWSHFELSIQCFQGFLPNKKCLSKQSRLWNAVSGSNSKVFLWPEILHWRANGFANSWWIFPEAIKNFHHSNSDGTSFYKKNLDGSIDFEMVMEFWPQRLFYWGISLSIAVFVVTLLLLFVRYLSRQLFFPPSR